MGERLDPELLSRIMSRYYEAMVAVVNRHDGVVEKFIGDAVVALFGVPEMREDDALRSVRTALEMRDAVTELNEEFERRWGVSVTITMGINTGEIAPTSSGPGMGIVLGDVANVAARLEKVARPGEILLSAVTWRLVKHLTRTERLEAVALRGRSRPIEAVRLLDLAAPEAGGVRPLQPPFVGRRQEVEMIRDRFAKVVARRTPHLLCIVGPPGIGKSRLGEEAGELLRGTAAVLVGRCVPYGEGATFRPLINVVRQAAGILPGDPPGSARSKLRALLGSHEAARSLEDRLVRGMGLEVGDVEADETCESALTLFEWLSRRRPLVVFFDDVNWAEPTFLDLVERVVDSLDNAPILTVCLARPDLIDIRPRWERSRQRYSYMELEPLSNEECERLLSAMVGDALPDPEVRVRILEAAQGNPLFVREMLSMLIDDGLIRREGERWSLAAKATEFHVPPTIHTLVASRLERLDTDHRAVLEAAAVVGDTFQRSDLVPLCPGKSRQRVLEQLSFLAGKDLIRRDRAATRTDYGFRFRHLVVREVVYRATSKHKRSELHVSYADHLAGANVRDFPGREEMIGHHLERAYRYACELGSLDESQRALAARAAEQLANVGRRAARRKDFAAAVGFFDRASSLMSGMSAPRIRVLIDLGTALSDLGETARAEATLEECIRLGRATDERGLEWDALVRLCFLRMDVDPEAAMEEAGRLAEQAIRTFEELDDDEGLALARRLLAFVHSVGGERRATQLQAHDLVIEAGGRTFVTAASLSLRPGDKVGLVGTNGVGKTTLLRVLAGESSPLGGRVERRGALGYLRQEPRSLGTFEATTAVDQVLSGRNLDRVKSRLEGLRLALEETPSEALVGRFTRAEEAFRLAGGYTAEYEARRIAEGLGLAPERLDTPVATLSAGERRRVDLARILFAGTELLLLDEPTNYLDHGAKQWLMRFLACYEGGLLIVSYDLELLDDAITRVVHLEDGILTGHKGTYTQYLETRARAEEAQARHATRQELEVQRLSRRADTLRSLSPKRARQAQGMDKRAERLRLKRERQGDVKPRPPIEFPEPPPCADTVLEVRELTKNHGDEPIFCDLAFTLGRGERLLVVGSSGAGKSTLLRILAGEEYPDGGSVVLGMSVSAGYYAQAHEAPALAGSVYSQLRAHSRLPESALDRLLQSFGLAGIHHHQRAATLSGGEKSRLCLAQVAVARNNLLLLDEPTLNLDPAWRRDITNALREWPGTMVIVSSDGELLSALTPDRVLMLPEGTSPSWSDSLLEPIMSRS